MTKIAKAKSYSNIRATIMSFSRCHFRTGSNLAYALMRTYSKWSNEKPCGEAKDGTSAKKCKRSNFEIIDEVGTTDITLTQLGDIMRSSFK